MIGIFYDFGSHWCFFMPDWMQHVYDFLVQQANTHFYQQDYDTTWNYLWSKGIIHKVVCPQGIKI